MDRVKQEAVDGRRWGSASRACQLPLGLSSVLQTSACPEAEDRDQAVQMFKT